MQHQKWKKIIIEGALIITLGLMIGQPLNATIQPMTHGDQTRTSTDWWPMFHHDQNHTGTTIGTGPQTSHVLWTCETGAEIIGSPAVVDNKVYIGSWDKKVYCLNLTTGQKIWDYETGGEINSSPAVANGKVYIGSNDDKLYCLDAQSGAYLWNYTTGMAAVTSSPTVVDGRVYFGSRDHTMYCVNATTGSWIWNYYTTHDILSSPAVVDSRVYFGSWDTDIWCMDATTGGYIWNFYTANVISSSPSVADGKVFIGSNDGKLYCFDALNGALQWSHQTSAAIESSPAVTNGKVYVGSNNHKMYCLNESTGNQIWEFQGGDRFYSSPAMAGGMLYVDNYDGNFYCLNANTGAVIWSFQTGYKNWASPAIAEGKMIIASGDHKVYCFMDSNTPPVTPPAPDGPTNGTTHKLYNFTATTTDPQGDNISFLFDWGDGTNSSWLGPFPSGYMVNGTHAWTAVGNYSITVKAKDINGAESDWSPAHTITIREAPILKIQKVTGGLLKAKTFIKNIGDATATNIHWTFGSASGTIPSLGPGQQQKITSGMLIGFGKKVLKITASCAGSSDSKDQDVMLILIFVLIR